MDMKRSKRIFLTLAVVYWACVIVFYAVAQEQFHYTPVLSGALSPMAVTEEITDGTVIEQNVTVPAQRLEYLELMAYTYDRVNQGTLHCTLYEGEEAVAHGAVPVEQMANYAYTRVPLEEPLEGYGGENLRLRITTEGCAPGNAVALYFGNSVVAGRFDIAKDLTQEEMYTSNGVRGTGMLCAKLGGVNRLTAYVTYWICTTGAFIAALAYVLWGLRNAEKGKHNAIVNICTVCTRYDFLIRQLVSRDFKAKYKRSVLGMFWSFLNPLLTMAVQYIVFSTIFKSDTANYPVYLLSGIVIFNFFSEAVSMGMTSITGNASLINKVYMPKYTYPIARVLSSLVNFALAFLPIFLIMFLTGTPVRPAIVLLLFDIVCIVAFTMGMVLLLSTSMVFFRDTQFLWGVLSMMWMYLTPIFYTEAIIPAQFLGIYRANPMYQFLQFARTALIDGISPAPTAYLWCIGWAVSVLVIGILVFKKHQNKFVLYI